MVGTSISAVSMALDQSSGLSPGAVAVPGIGSAAPVEPSWSWLAGAFPEATSWGRICVPSAGTNAAGTCATTVEIMREGCSIPW